jgi:hypothetical protein
MPVNCASGRATRCRILALFRLLTGATLNVQANSDSVATLDVNGSVTGTGALTVGALNLGSGRNFHAEPRPEWRW